jgi:hypothetical protein
LLPIDCIGYNSQALVAQSIDQAFDLSFGRWWRHGYTVYFQD